MNQHWRAAVHNSDSLDQYASYLRWHSDESRSWSADHYARSSLILNLPSCITLCNVTQARHHGNGCYKKDSRWCFHERIQGNRRINRMTLYWECTYHITLSSLVARKKHRPMSKRIADTQGLSGVFQKCYSVPVTMYTVMSMIPHWRLRAEGVQIIHRGYYNQ